MAELQDPDGGPSARIMLAAEDLFMVTVPVAAPATRGAVAAALAGVAPVPLSRVDWGWRDMGDGRVRVAMAHRDRVDALVRGHPGRPVAVLADGIVVRPARAVPSPWWLLACVPLVTGIGAWGLATVAERRVPQEMGGGQAMSAFQRIAVSEILALLDAGLPREAMVHIAERQAGGAILLEIDTIDPGTVRAALARDPRLATFRVTGQDAVADRGIRVRLRSDRL